MRNLWKIHGMSMVLAGMVLTAVAWAEKTEIVTYYPAPQQGASLWAVSPGNPNDIYNLNTGNVGIGVANPAQKLSVSGSINGVLLAGLNNPNPGTLAYSEWRIGEDLTGNQRYIAIGYMNSGFTPLAYLNPNQGQITASSLATNGLVIGTDANAPIKFVTNSAGANNERMRITGNGNVGIGTAAPAARLEVAGNVKVTDGTQGAGKVLTSDGNGLASWQMPGAILLAVKYYANASTLLTNTASYSNIPHTDITFTLNQG